MRIPGHKVFLGAGIAATAAYLLAPRGMGADLLYEVIGAAAVAAIALAGVRQERRRPWLLMAAGQALFVAGDVLWLIYDRVLHIDPWPSPADVLYLAGYPVLATALWLLLRERSPSRDGVAVLDAAIVSVACGVLTWNFVIGPIAEAPGQSLLELLISLAYPVMDVLLLVVLARLVAAPGSRSASFRLLAGSAAALLVADASFMLVSPNGGYVVQGPIDALWLSSYVLWAVAALHPSAGALRVSGKVVVKPSRRRLILLACAALTCPVVLVASSSTGHPTDVPILGAGSVAIFLLVIARMAGLVRHIEAQVVLLDEQHRALKDTISEKAALAERLQHQAFHDSLTGLPNRALFRDRVKHALERGRRNLGRPALLFIDLDEFKEINDALGHEAGDRVLAEVGRRMRLFLRESDTVARLGGDEFAILIEDAQGADDVAETVARVHHSLADAISVGGASVHVRASVGVALGELNNDVDDLLRNADAAMYQAKRDSRPPRGGIGADAPAAGAGYSTETLPHSI
jgi:diguanylate cyclase